MKIGTLVELSAYARKLAMYEGVVSGDVGLITAFRNGFYTIFWQRTSNRASVNKRVLRKDIKYVKRRTA